eukprot:m.431578 g.431578  ORF g.431578 m.431578 type:complete len:256 (-) comp21405_c0_seq4:2849-3616(-)
MAESIELLLDPQIRMFVIGPIVLITLLVGFGRHYLMSSMAPKKSELVQVMEAQALMRSRTIAANGKFLNREAFEMRRQYFVSSSDPDSGFFKRKKRDVPPPNPMQDPSQMNNMMMGSMTNMIPMVVIAGIINSVFSGFVMIKVPFPLTLRYKPMLQRGIQLTTLSSSWVSSASFYFICVFGLRGVLSLVLGPNNDSDSMRAMQGQMMGQGMGQPQDPGKAFTAASNELEIVKHKWELSTAERKFLSSSDQKSKDT